MTTLAAQENAADTRWRRWLADGERRARRREWRVRLVIVAIFMGLAGWMLIGLAAR